MRAPKLALARLFAVMPMLLCLSSCILGPGSVLYSRGNYNRAVQQTAREELLLNIVRMRYVQSVEFMRVPSITAQHTYDASVGGSGSWREKLPNVYNAAFGLGAQSKPTVVYAPEQDQEFNRRLLAPISGETLDLLGSKGWSIDRVLRLTVRNMNDIDNATPAGGPTPTYKPVFEEFRIVSMLFRQLQVNGRGFEVGYKEVETKPELELSDAMPANIVRGEDLILAAKEGMRFRLSDDRSTAKLVRKPVEERIEFLLFSEEVLGTSEFGGICRILELDPTIASFRIRSDAEVGQLSRPHSNRIGRYQTPRKEIIVSTRSLKEAMYYLSHVVEVPDSHIEKKIVQQTFDETGCPFDWKEVVGDLFQVHYSHLPPHNAAVAIRHRGLWFYIDDSDISSKSTFNLLLELFNLEIRAGGGAQIPLLTI